MRVRVNKSILVSDVYTACIITPILHAGNVYDLPDSIATKLLSRVDMAGNVYASPITDDATATPINTQWSAESKTHVQDMEIR